LTIGRRGWVQRPLSGKAGQRQTKIYNLASGPSTQDKTRKGIGILMLALKKENGVRKVLPSVVTEHKRLLVLE
jgi:hypothetical protein